jgi:hypothetical protein
MKTKKLEKKLSVRRQTIAQLNNVELRKAVGASGEYKCIAPLSYGCSTYTCDTCYNTCYTCPNTCICPQ